jgi:hypothetical protein
MKNSSLLLIAQRPRNFRRSVLQSREGELSGW